MSVSFAQYILKENPIVFDESEFQRATIEKKIIDTRKITSREEINKVKLEIQKHNLLVSAHISSLKKTQQDLFEKQNQLEEKKTISDLIIERTNTQKKYEEIYRNTKTNLNTIGKRAIYIYIRNDIDPFEPKSKWSGDAIKQITPVAIEKIRGSVIKSVTEMHNNGGSSSEILEYIKEEVAGKMKQVKSIDGILKAQNKYWNAQIVEVLPLANRNNNFLDASASENNENHIIIDGSDDLNSIDRQLRNKGINSSKVIDYIKKFIADNTSQLKLHNYNSKTHQENIIKDGEEKLNELNDQILTINKEIEETNLFFENFLKKNTNITYDRLNADSSILKAKLYIDDQINKSYASEIYLKENELKDKHDQKISVANQLAFQASNTVMDLIQKLNNDYGSTEELFQVKKLVNDQYSKNSNSKEKITGKINKLWVYLYVDDDDNYSLSVIAKFKISSNYNAEIYKAEYLEDAIGKNKFLLDADELLKINTFMNSQSEEMISESVIQKTENLSNNKDGTSSSKIIVQMDSLVNEIDNMRKTLEYETNDTPQPETESFIPPTQLEQNTDDSLSGMMTKMKETDAEITQQKNLNSKNLILDKKIKKYKRKRGFQKTLMYLSLAAGGYFTYSSIAAKGDYDDATNPEDAAKYRALVEDNNLYSYIGYGVATYNLFCATRYKIKKNKAIKEKAKLNTGIGLGKNYTGLALSFTF